MAHPHPETAMTATRITLISFLLLGLLGAARSVHAQEAKIDKGDRRALARLAQSDMAEIQTGKLAAEKASNPDVKKYAQHMVDEHTQMLEEGRKLAQSKGVKPPASTDKKHQAALEKLKGLSGDEFDRQYMQQMVRDHREVLKLAQKTANAGKDAELKAHAQKGTPHIEEHLKTAQQLAASLKK
jgi:putative membrane protein